MCLWRRCSWTERRSPFANSRSQFLVPDGVREHFRAGIGRRGAEARDEWMKRFEAREDDVAFDIRGIVRDEHMRHAYSQPA
jgi:hypothetical protein